MKGDEEERKQVADVQQTCANYKKAANTHL